MKRSILPILTCVGLFAALVAPTSAQPQSSNKKLMLSVSTPTFIFTR
jgi:hypothetical protein